MHILVHDTETSGLPLFKDPSEDPRQPHLCELAAYMFDADSMQVVDLYHALVKQDGWSVEPEAFKAHGITKERSMAEGVDEKDAFYNFHRLSRLSQMRVAHNGQFDDRIHRIGIMRFGDGVVTTDTSDIIDRTAFADQWRALPSYCTMKETTNILNLPATEAMRKSGRGSWKKQPSLKETYNHFFHEDFDGAHSAKADAWACARVYFFLTRKHDIGRTPATLSDGGVLAGTNRTTSGAIGQP
jgi:DNA polymerase III subunit epsilon